MAIEKKKMKDPAEAALSAVEQALNLDEKFAIQPPGRSDDASSRDELRLPDIDDHDFTKGPFGMEADGLDEPMVRTAKPEARPEDGPRASFIAPDRNAVANDDRQNVGMMLQALQVRPSRRAYVFATLLSLLWIGTAGAYVYSLNITTPEQLLATFTPTQLAIGAALVLGPILLLYIAAMLTVRSQEMKLVARAISEVAVRLAQPESFSTDAVLSVSQAVRREVAAVGDGVERALARAGELETWSGARSRRWNAPIRTTRSASARSSTNSSPSAKRSSATRSACAAPSPEPTRLSFRISTRRPSGSSRASPAPANA
jgi:hypothetical protein